MANKLPSHIKLYAQNPSGSYVDYGQYEGIDLSISDTSPGGHETAEFTICNPNNDLPALGSKVWVFNEERHKIVWLGRIGQPKIKYPTGPANITCYGYSDHLEDRGFDHSRVYPSGTSFSDIIQDAVTQLCSELAAGGIDFGGSGLNIAEDTGDYALSTASDVINNLIALTSQFQTPLVYHVWEATDLANYPKLFFSFQDPLHGRYRMLLSDRATCDSTYDLHSQINESIIQWGNQQFVVEPSASGTPISYEAIKVIRSKRLNAENDIRVFGIASNMAASLLERFKVLRAVTDNIEICAGEKVTAIPPVTTTIDNDYPLELVRSGYAIDILNIDAKFRPYIHRTKYIVGKRFSFVTGTLSLTCGEIVSLGSAVRNIQAAVTSRPFLSSAMSAQSYALTDNDLLPTFGPEFSGASPPNMTGGIPVFVKDKELPEEAVIHPDLIADEGLEANHTIGDLTVGPKGSIKVIPGLYKRWEAVFDNANTVDSIEVQVYKETAATKGVLHPVINIRISTNKRANGLILPNVTMGRDDRFYFEVKSPEPTTAVLLSIDLFGTRLYPGLKL